MHFIEWLPYYLQIAKYLNIDIKNDFFSSLILSNTGDNKNFDIRKFYKLTDKKILIIGAGPSIENPVIQKFIQDNSSYIILTADGATELCLKLDIVPDFVITDLDGNIESLIDADRLGSNIVIHAHGNNIDKIKQLVPQFNNIFRTTQTLPLSNVYNFGGFTDGDRCLFLADEFRSKEIFLVGMDFDVPAGFYSKKNKIIDQGLKKKKLSVGKRLIEILAKKSKFKISNVTISGHNSSIDGVVDYKLT